MAAQKGAKRGTTVRRRRERKNIDRGAAHIQSTFNNTIVTITDTQGNAILGQVPVSWALEVLESPPPLPHKPQQKPQQKQRWSTA